MLGPMTAVLVVTGPVGVGKSAVLNEADAMLGSAGVPHATTVSEEVARCGPAGAGDPYNE
jgi:nucleoside-triphosphatase THEP1